MQDADILEEVYDGRIIDGMCDDYKDKQKKEFVDQSMFAAKLHPVSQLTLCSNVTDGEQINSELSVNDCKPEIYQVCDRDGSRITCFNFGLCVALENE